MKERYEEYRDLGGRIPFILNENIRRTALLRSDAANWHENLELQIFTSGAGYVSMDGVRTDFTAGDVACINSGVLHYTGTETELVYTCLIVDAEFCRAADIDPAALQFRHRITDGQVRARFEKLVRHYRDTADPCRTARVRADLLELLIRLRDRHYIGERTAGTGGVDTVKEAVRHIRTHYAEPLTLDDIARAVFVNKYVLSRAFKSSTGMTVFEYLALCRCRAAARLMDEGKSVSEAATASGFSHLSYFSRTYRRYMGKLPSQHKAKKGNKA